MQALPSSQSPSKSQEEQVSTLHQPEAHASSAVQGLPLAQRQSGLPGASTHSPEVMACVVQDCPTRETLLQRPSVHPSAVQALPSSHSASTLHSDVESPSPARAQKPPTQSKPSRQSLGVEQRKTPELSSSGTSMTQEAVIRRTAPAKRE
jgi:hypothetical protein